MAPSWVRWPGSQFPVEAFALAVSIMLRFIPVIQRELQRFSRITRARGRSNANLGGLSVRDIPVLVIPLLLSVLKLGEDLSLAMGASGYGSFHHPRTSSLRLRYQRADWWTIGIGLLLAVFIFDLKSSIRKNKGETAGRASLLFSFIG